MIQILSKADVNKIIDPVLKAGVLKEFARLPDDFKYPEYGYFIVIERVEELSTPVELSEIISQYTTRPLVECVEMIEGFDGYAQVVCILYADFGISLFVSEEIATQSQLEILF